MGVVTIAAPGADIEKPTNIEKPAENEKAAELKTVTVVKKHGCHKSRESRF